MSRTTRCTACIACMSGGCRQEMVGVARDAGISFPVVVLVHDCDGEVSPAASRSLPSAAFRVSNVFLVQLLFSDDTFL